MPPYIKKAHRKEGCNMHTQERCSDFPEDTWHDKTTYIKGRVA